MNTEFKNYLHSLTPAKRRLAEETMQYYFACERNNIEKLDSASNIYNYCKDLSTEEVEHAVVLLCKNNYSPVKRIEIGRGGLTETAFDVRLALKECLLNNATVMAIVHNHPSGRVAPSREDDNITKGFAEACRTMRIHFVDHVIIGDGDYYSYRDNGKL